jgi:retron-type reverse transcriptase
MSVGQLTFEAFRTLNRRVDEHRDCREEWLERHKTVSAQAAAFGRNGRAEIGKYLYQRIRDERNLILACEHLQSEGGSAPGPDELTWDEIGDLVFKYADSIRDEIDDGLYQHGPTDVRRVRKNSGTGTRPLHLINLSDRVVHRAVVQVVGPLLDSLFSPHSFGGRPDLDRRHALAAAEQIMAAGRRVLLSEDIKNAFEHVPQQRMLDLLGKYLPVRPADEVKRRKHGLPVNEGLHSLLRKLIVTETGTGLRQGAATSTLFMNLYAHHHLDVPWRRANSATPLLRYIDDILVPCNSAAEAETARSSLVRMLLPAGWSVKEPKDGKPTVYDLDAGYRVPGLGFRIAWGEDGLLIRIGERSMQNLKASFASMGSATEQEIGAKVLQWAAQMGPAYEHAPREKYYLSIGRMIRHAGLRGIPPRARFERAWRMAYERWLPIRKTEALLTTG